MKLSIVIPTLNNAKILTGFFEKIKNQDYPKNNVEIVVADGGSKDKTISIAKKYGANVYNNKKIMAEPGVVLAMSKTTGDVIIVLAADNYLYDTQSFKKYALTFDSPDIYAAFPKHESKPWDSIYTKYINVFTDPFSHFVYGYAANGRTFRKIYKTLISNDTYEVYDLKENSEAPLIAFAQGFAIRSNYKRNSKHLNDDIKPVMDIIESGKKIAFIHSLSLYHHTVKDFDHFVRKQRWGTRNAISSKKYGISYRTNNLSDKQRLRMKIWPLYALSFFAPMLYSTYHLALDREKLWIFHAPLCFISASASLYEVLVYNVLRKERVVSRQK